ncbi:trafficking protein particle complex subunit 11-like [Antedon mediterranea]|uniref:trafficking protein particle complex subunit 11-like n=1 Tax=Antedon mediterranea TaxID=105859 RepID=UPI003AF71E6A
MSVPAGPTSVPGQLQPALSPSGTSVNSADGSSELSLPSSAATGSSSITGSSAMAGYSNRGPGGLPTELTCRPMGLVVLTGLDITYNAIHRDIWDSFVSGRRPDRVPLNFKVLPGDHEYPKCRSKQRTSYEWYIPKGILKSGWMKKHLSEVPSLVVLFYDLDWDENLWKERQMECATRVEVVRTSLQGRLTRVAVVLIQKNAPLPPGEDVVAAERAAALCAACDLSAKSLFVLPWTGHLLGYTVRLENAFYELSQSYYHMEARKVKAHREFLNKTTHQLLFVRHAFKIAFFSELKQDAQNALKQYKTAYGHLTELRAHDSNMLEIKTIAGFINYKICQQLFTHNAPLDAISQFRKHIDLFKNRVGCPELAFENSDWMSKQFSIFGELFDEAIKMGLTAIQTQHPGFYYQQAANHAIARKQLCRGLCQHATHMPSPNPLEGANNLDFFGQRPWRQGHQSIDPPDAQMEKEGITALQYQELLVDHSWIIIPLLSSAVAQFKKYKSARMKRFLMVQMGEEYYHAKDYSKGLTLLGRVTWDYRSERWWSLLTSILVTSLRCAYLVASLEEYVTISLEIMGRYSQSSPEEKTRVQMNLIRVMSNVPPEAEPGCSSEAVEQAKGLWKGDVTKAEQPKTFTLEMQNIVPFVEFKACFSKNRFTADVPITLNVYIRPSCQFPIRFSKLSVQLSNPIYNAQCIVTDGQPIGEPIMPHDSDTTGDLYLIPNKVKVYTFQFIAVPEDVGKKIEIVSISLSLGDEANRCAHLHWSGGGGDAASVTNIQECVSKRRGEPKEEELDWHLIKIEQATSIASRIPLMEIKLEHAAPSIVNEPYSILATITNKEKTTIRNASITMGLKEGQDSQLEQTTQVSEDIVNFEQNPSICKSRLKGINIEDLASDQQIVRQLYVRCLQVGTRSIIVRVAYTVDAQVEKQASAVSCVCYKDEDVKLDTVMPFDVSIRLTSSKFEEVSSVYAGEPFLMMTDIKCTSPWPLQIVDSHLTLSTDVDFTDEDVESQLKGILLKKYEQACECLSLVTNSNQTKTTISLGQYTVQWRRASDDSDQPIVKTEMALPDISVEHLPLHIDTDLPSHGLVRVPLALQFTIVNHTEMVQNIEASIDPSEAFMFSGHKQVFFRILPSDDQTLLYNLYPLIPGYVKLPRLHLKTPQAPTITDDVVSKMIPSHIYIKPQGKTIINT